MENEKVKNNLKGMRKQLLGLTVQNLSEEELITLIEKLHLATKEVLQITKNIKKRIKLKPNYYIRKK